MCRKHGGKGGRRPSHGLYSFDMSRLGEEIQEKIERHLANPDATNLTQELALVRAYFEGFLFQITPADSEDPPLLTSEILKTFLGFVSRIARLAKSQAEIEWGPQHLITASQAMAFFEAVGDAVNRHVASVEERKRVFDQVEQALGLGGLEGREEVHTLATQRTSSRPELEIGG